ncbi:MAG: PQQ-binding-like beta-propeller repeat protein [Aureispira sp.]|nr:PQQ-binding-like beta-propeller repeat protein [Aureispira sp.]
MSLQKTLALVGLLLLNVWQIQAQKDPEIVVTSGHISNVMSISFSDDGKFIVTGGMDKTVRIWSKSLRQEFRVLYGHTDVVWKAVYTSDGKYIISVDGKGNIITWNHSTGDIMQRMKFDAYNRYFAYIPNTHEILVNKDGKIQAVDILTGYKTNSYAAAAMSTEMVIMPDGEHLVARGSKSPNQVALLNYKTGEEIKRFDGGGMPSVMQRSPDGKKVAAYIITTQNVIVWDVETGKEEFKVKIPAAKPVKDLEFTPNNKEILIMTQMAEVMDYSIKTGKLKRSMNDASMDPAKMASGVYSIGTGWDFAMSPDGKMIALTVTLSESKGKGQMPTNFMGGILMDYHKGKELGRLKGFFKMATHLSVASNSKYLISSTFDKHPGLRIWNLKEGELERFIPTTGTAAASSDGKAFAIWEMVKDKMPVLNVYNSNNIKVKYAIEGIETISAIALNADATILAIQGIELNKKDYTKNKYYFRIWNTEENKELNKFYFEITDVPMFNGLRLSPDGNHLIVNSSNGFISWEVASGKKIAHHPSQVGYDYLLDFVPNSTKMLVGRTEPKVNMETHKLEAPMKWLEWDYVSNSFENEFNTKEEGILFSGNFSPDGKYLVTGQGGYFEEVHFRVTVWDWETRKHVCTLEGHHGEIEYVWFGKKGKRIYSSAKDGFIKVWNLEECKLSASLIAQKEIDYIIISPNNYYKASKGNNEGICFRYNDHLYTFDQFDLRFNRPDKVLTDLGVSKYSVKLYTKAWEKRISKMGFAPEDLEGELHLPNIDITNKLDLPISTTDKNIKLALKASDEGHKIDRISISINGVPLPKRQGISVKDKYTNKLDQELEVELSEGKNLVKVSVFNDKGLESVRESFQINYDAHKHKPNLYVLALGVSEFKDKERNLKFATQDATDLSDKLKDSKFFGDVFIEKVFNEDATKNNVMKVAKFLKKAHTNDQIIIYISSHGLLNDELDYFIAMHDVDFANPTAKGLPYEDIDAMLDGLACRNRLIMIDACHSGEVDKDEAVVKGTIANTDVKVTAKAGTTFVRPKAGLKNSFSYMKTLFNDVTKGTGATVISAAGGYEFALESDDWNNGVFTYSILNGLTSGDADMNGDGYVRVSELKNYVTLQVVELTNGKQHPTTRSENALNDYILYEIKKDKK